MGRWHLSQGDNSPVLWLDLPIDEAGIGAGGSEHGPLSVTTVLAAEARCLVTDRALRFACYSGKVSRFGQLTGTTAVVFQVPLDAISRIDPGRSNAFMTSSPLMIDIGEWNASVSVKKAAPANDAFGSGIFARAKNKDFAAQIEAAKRGLAVPNTY